MSNLSLLISEFVEGIHVPCSDVSPEIFFPEDIENENGKLIKSVYTHEGEAKTICISCPVRIQCLTSALEKNAIGIWGGTTETERRTIKRHRKDPATVSVKMVGKRIRKRK